MVEVQRKAAPHSGLSRYKMYPDTPFVKNHEKFTRISWVNRFRADPDDQAIAKTSLVALPERKAQFSRTRADEINGERQPDEGAPLHDYSGL